MAWFDWEEQRLALLVLLARLLRALKSLLF